ncbi:hypothetical protein GGR28_000578 [Lewinella aquimaris]|uniref:Uncharacterized protein n=1 Tax=Neolewinella aquimaris TaxID=1835722 RepID=A0A840E4E7_9BACT|nr:hypothetical protein [Neolewinella aquimaris]MBB4077977.1 hypothetical protein [Neolewinella aquimaris]
MVASINRRQTIFGVEFTLGGTVSLEDGSPDLDRSGVTFAFDRRDLIEQIKPDFAAAQNGADFLKRSTNLDPSVLSAYKYECLRSYLDFVNSESYRSIYVEATHVADSLKGYVEDEFDPASLELVRKKRLLDSLSRFYDGIWEEVSSLPAAQRMHGKHLLDSLRRFIPNEDPVEATRRKLSERGELTGWRRFLLATKDFSVGNTRLPYDGSTSIGLPIRGLSYAYDKGGITADIQIGKRVASRRFVPRDGIAYHDFLRDFMVGRIAVGYHFNNLGNYKLSILSARETRRQDPKDSSRRLSIPKKNRVLTFYGSTPFGEKFGLVSEISHSQSRDGNTSLLPDVVEGEDLAAEISASAGLSYETEFIRAEISGFRTGFAYQSLANPYLYNDYQGLEANLKITSPRGSLDGSFSLAGGYGTTPATLNQFRLRAQGQIRLSVAQNGHLLAMASPNLYRYEVTGQEGLTESSIFQLIYNQIGYINNHPWDIQAGITNLNQGITWADSTSASTNLVGTLSGTLAVSEALSFSTDVQQTILYDATRPLDNRFTYALNASLGKNRRVGGGIRYGTLFYSNVPSWSGELDITVAIGKWASAHLSFLYQPGQDTSQSEYSAPSIVSQQNWFSKF